MKSYKFIKTGLDWYIDLPEFLEQGGSIGDLQMVDGADKMLDNDSLEWKRGYIKHF